jgi:hypothetical protein
LAVQRQWLRHSVVIGCFALAGCGGGGEVLGRLPPGAAGSGGAGGEVGSSGAGGNEVGPTLGPFGPATLIAELSDPDAEDEDPSLTADLLELYFKSNRGGNHDIWVSRRSATNDPWGSPLLVSELSSPETDQTPSVSLDGLTLWLSSDRPSMKPGFNIWVSTRPFSDSAWSEPTEVMELNTEFGEVGPATDEGDLVMMFGSYRDMAARWDMYVSTRLDRSSAWGSVELASDVNTGGNDWDVFVNNHGLRAFFTSDRAGNDDLYEATRVSLSSPFGSVVPLVELNTSFKETDPALSPDERHIAFGSNRSGDPEIYWADR